MRVVQEKFLNWFMEELQQGDGDLIRKAKNIPTIFHTGVLEVSKEQAQIYIENVVNKGLYEEDELCDLYWTLGVNKHKLSCPEALGKLIANIKTDRGPRLVNAIMLLIELFTNCTSEGMEEIYNNAYKYVHDTLKLTEHPDTVFIAIRGLGCFINSCIDRNLVIESIDTLYELLHKHKDNDAIYEQIIDTLGKILRIDVYYDYICYFEKKGGFDFLLRPEEESRLVKFESYLSLFKHFATFDTFYEKYKDALLNVLLKFGEVHKKEKFSDDINEFSNTISRTKAIDFDSITYCTEELSPKPEYEQQYICLDCSKENPGFVFCKHCFETYHKGHSFMKVFGNFTCDQKELGELGEPPRKRPRIEEQAL